MIVAMVAAGSLDMHQAIPMIMGANIGTTITSNIVSLSFISQRNIFGRAFSSATLHDHFNILITIIIFPLQYQYNFLGFLSDSVISLFSIDPAAGAEPLGNGVIKGKWIVSEFVLGVIENPVIVLILAVISLFTSIKLFTNIIYKLFIGSARIRFEKLIFKNRLKSFGWGALITAGLQSSSVTTSLIVPLVATGKIRLRNVYPFIVGANIGTTITALLAALFKSQEAVGIAVAHLLFNLIGGIVFLGIPGLNRVPILLAERLGELAMRYRIISLIYMVITFFLLPFAFIYLTK
jgi:sodium-dependent phosphate cotransporter